VYLLQLLEEKCPDRLQAAKLDVLHQKADLIAEDNTQLPVLCSSTLRKLTLASVPGIC